MKKIIPGIVILLLFVSCQTKKRPLDEILNAKYEQHFISSGDNFPQISLKKNNRYKFLIGLHNGYLPGELKINLKWTDRFFNQEINLLKENGYLKEVNQKFFPSINIIMQDEANELYDLAEEVANEITKSIISIERQIKTKYKEMTISKEHPYSEFSFFILSDVLLDNWQINNVEELFLESERPLRHGKRYYIQYAEKDPNSKIEVFGIYGNQYNCNDSLCFITYGNNRKNNFKTLQELSEMDIPFLSKKDQAILKEMAELYKPKLIEILKRNKETFVKNYENSTFKNENSFEEYFIWFYHFLYTSATNNLNKKNYLNVPESGIYRVKLEK